MRGLSGFPRGLVGGLAAHMLHTSSVQCYCLLHCSGGLFLRKVCPWLLLFLLCAWLGGYISLASGATTASAGVSGAVSILTAAATLTNSNSGGILMSTGAASDGPSGGINLVCVEGFRVGGGGWGVGTMSLPCMRVVVPSRNLPTVRVVCVCGLARSRVALAASGCRGPSQSLWGLPPEPMEAPSPFRRAGPRLQGVEQVRHPPPPPSTLPHCTPLSPPCTLFDLMAWTF